MATLVQAVDLRKRFGDIIAVAGISLEVGRGEVSVSYTHLTLPTTPYV